MRNRFLQLFASFLQLSWRKGRDSLGPVANPETTQVQGYGHNQVPEMCTCSTHEKTWRSCNSNHRATTFAALKLKGRSTFASHFLTLQDVLSACGDGKQQWPRLRVPFVDSKFSSTWHDVHLGVVARLTSADRTSRASHQAPAKI